MGEHRADRSREAAGLVVGLGALLLLLIVGNFFNVVSFSSPCSPNAVSCAGAGGTQTWWGLSMTDATWYSGDPNYLALLFVAAAVASIAWGSVAMRAKRNPTVLGATGALLSVLVVGALAANLVRLSQFTSYWIHWSCLAATCSSVSTHNESGVACTIVLTVLLVAAIALACSLYGKRVSVEVPQDETVKDDVGSISLNYDHDADAAYIRIVANIQRGEVKRSEVLDDDMVNCAVVVDFDDHDQMLGIEVLGPRQLLRHEVLKTAVPYPSERRRT